MYVWVYVYGLCRGVNFYPIDTKFGIQVGVVKSKVEIDCFKKYVILFMDFHVVLFFDKHNIINKIRTNFFIKNKMPRL